jgi:ferritin-like metal-binding protein YciE
MATTKSTHATSEMTADVNESALNELFIDELKDIYWAEKHLTKALPKMAKAATSGELRTAIENHLSETENHVSRLEQVFSSIGEKAVAVKCEAMAGLIKEGDEIVSETDKGTITRDVGIISASQKIEHYEIASYGTLKTLAGVLGYDEAAELLDATLQEEKNADNKLTGIAEGNINQSAKREKK